MVPALLTSMLSAALILMLMPLHPDDVIIDKDAADFVILVLQAVLASLAADDLFAHLPVLGTNQAVVAADHDVIHLIPVPLDGLANPREGPGQARIPARFSIAY